MAGKLNKILLGGAVIGAALAGGAAYFLTKKEKEASTDEDFTAEEATEGDTPITREYVTIPKERPCQEETVADDTAEETTEETTEEAEEEISADEAIEE